MRLRFSLASRLMLLPVALLPVIADWPHAELHVRSLGEAVEHSAQLRSRAVLQYLLVCSLVLSLVLLTLPASPDAGTANDAVCVAHGHAAAGRQTCRLTTQVLSGMPCRSATLARGTLK